MATSKLTIKERIESHIISKDNCWITDYKPDFAGRPRIMIDGKFCILARVVYKIYKDDLPRNRFVCHRCDNLLCINPDHLYLGKNRRNQTTNSATSGSKLSEVEVKQIRGLLVEGKLTFKQIAKMFGVSCQTIRLINNGESWTQVEGIGLKIKTKRTGSIKLDNTKVAEIRDLLAKEKFTMKQIGEIFNVSPQTIGLINKSGGSRIRGSRQSNNNIKLNVDQVKEIRDLLIEGNMTFKEIGEKFGVSSQTIYLINIGKIWTNVEGIGSKLRTEK
jgi:DNA-binding XRE family transcriptional regulator